MTSFLKGGDFLALAPLIILFIAALILILVESFFETFSKKFAFSFTFFTLSLALSLAFKGFSSSHLLIIPWLTFDFITYFFTLFFLITGLAFTLLSFAFFERFSLSQGEYYFLLLSSVFGLILIAASADFLTLFIGIETLSLALYVLCGYMKKWNHSNESAIKYFFMGAIAAAFLVYGIALIYGAAGTTNFKDLLSIYQQLTLSTDRLLFLSGVAFVTLGLAFKAAIFPFHSWAPDVYAGAPHSVTAFMAVGTKAGALVALIRVFIFSLPSFSPYWNQGVAWLAAFSLIYANFVALKQTQVRRFFAYSGMAQAGILLIPFVTYTSEVVPALLFYLVTYACATFGCFAVLAFMDQKKEEIKLDDLKGLSQKSPLLAVLLSICLLTLAGMPPLVGFFAKFFIFKVAFEAGYYFLVAIGLFTSILSAYYYLKILSVMWGQKAKENHFLSSPWPSLTLAVIACLTLLLLSIHPQSLLLFLQ